MEKKIIITVGRQYGSGGRFIAKKLAEALNIPFYDNELIMKAAESSGLSKAVLKSFDEKVDGIFSGIFPSTFVPEASLGSKVFLAQFEAIKNIANEGSCVIVGRCADYVLKDTENLVNIFITAPLESRVKRATTYYNLEEKKASEVITKMDKKRASYYNFYTDMKWGAAMNYDLCINSDIGIDESVEVIKAFINKKIK